MTGKVKNFSHAECAILLLLYSSGISRSNNEPIEGKTRLMKLVFLLDKESQSDYPLIHLRNFIAHYYGPYSPQVSVALERLLAYEYVHERVIWVSSDRRISIHVLSDKGVSIAKGFWEEVPTEAKKDLFLVKNAYNGMSMTKLLHYVYTSFPEFTARSKLVKEDMSHVA